MHRLAPLVLCIAIALACLSSAAPASTSPQALRVCVDRWNQANMVGWGPALADIAVRRLTAAEVHNVGFDVRSPRCVASIAAKLGEETFVCVTDAEGAYECSWYSDGSPRLRHANAKLDTRGVLKFDYALAGTHPTPPLFWQRYPHVDGLIHPWTRAGALRRGLSFYSESGARLRGTCSRGSERTRDPAALMCYSGVQFDACYAPTAEWNRPGTTVACASPGRTRFSRFVISRR